MVDFQSRDTKRGHRGLTEDDDDEGEDDDATEEDQAVADESTDGTEAAVTETESAAGAATDADSESSTDASEPSPTGDERTDDTAATGADADHERESRTVTEEYAEDALPYAVVTVAGDRSIEDDRTGDAVIDAVTHAEDAVVTRELLAPSYDGVQSAIGALVDRDDVEAIVTLGGTGVEPSDVTVDAVEDLFDKHLPGFGELFRVLSHEQEGTAIVRTRATAGMVDDVPVFCLPGDPTSARRGVEQIVLAEAPQLVAQARAADEGAD